MNDNNIEHSYDALKKYNNEDIVEFINKNLNEDEKIEMLRNKFFIKQMPSNLLTLMLNNMNFISVFNMLQNKNIFDKTNNLNIKLTPKDTIFINEYLSNENIINKVNHNMLKNMLINVSKVNIISYLSKWYIRNKLTNDDIISIAITKKISLVDDIYFIESLSKNEIIKYIEGFFQKNGINYDLLENNYVKKQIFNYSYINFEEVIYLYDLLSTKSNHNFKEPHHSLLSFKAVVALYEILGLEKGVRLLNDNNYGLDDITYALNCVDICKINNTQHLKDFVYFYIKSAMDKKYDNYIVNFGNIVNSFKDEYEKLTIYEIEQLLIKELPIKQIIPKEIYKNYINNAFDSNIKSRTIALNLRYMNIKNYESNINIKGNCYEVLNNSLELLNLDYDVSSNNFVIKVNDKYLYATIDDNTIFLRDDLEVSANIINEIADKLLLLDNINYIVLETERKDINGIKLSNEKESLLIKNNIPYKFNDENKNKRISH